MTRMVKLTLVVALMLVLGTITAVAQVHYLNAGVRFSSTVDNSYSRFGFEVSYTTGDFGPLAMHGPVFAVDAGSDDVRFHFGYEVVTLLTVGLEVGPTIVLPHKGDPVLAVHTTVFAGLIAYPFLQYTSVDRDATEFGLMLKYPIVADQ